MLISELSEKQVVRVQLLNLAALDNELQPLNLNTSQERRRGCIDSIRADHIHLEAPFHMIADCIHLEAQRQYGPQQLTASVH